MSKRHFEAIAAILAGRMSAGHFNDSDEIDPTVEAIAREMADLFAQENSRFDRARFLAACGVED